MNIRDHFDGWSVAVILVTLILFVAALFTKGFTHDLLLEAGVFLVSVKLILMSYKNSLTEKAIQNQLRDIQSLLEQTAKSPSSASDKKEKSAGR